MGDWLDYGEGYVVDYGYDESDSDAFDRMERKLANKKMYAEFEKDLKNAKKAPKKNYHNSKVKRFGFSNFKPFGKKVQRYSKKPITLIYGPNSIGKSSLIHMSAYSSYLQKTKSFDLQSTDMFGDNINLGGFSKFIHKRDKNNILTLEYEFDDCRDAIFTADSYKGIIIA